MLRVLAKSLKALADWLELKSQPPINPADYVTRAEWQITSQAVEAAKNDIEKLALKVSFKRGV